MSATAVLGWFVVIAVLFVLVALARAVRNLPWFDDEPEPDPPMNPEERGLLE
ncbi:MAG: hypothetical protein ACRDPK_03700 [Carbonactinosporaceae bacterium]